MAEDSTFLVLQEARPPAEVRMVEATSRGALAIDREGESVCQVQAL